jgi:hypothetical protein
MKPFGRNSVTSVSTTKLVHSTTSAAHREGDHASPGGELGAHGVESVRVGDSEGVGD